MADKTIEELDAMTEAERMAWFTDRIQRGTVPPSTPEFVAEAVRRAAQLRAGSTARPQSQHEGRRQTDAQR